MRDQLPFSGWPTRVRNCLRAAGYKSESDVKDALSKNWMCLMKLERFGRGCDLFVKHRLAVNAGKDEIERAIFLLHANGYTVSVE